MRLVHSDSGNCGRQAKLRKDFLAHLGSHEKFSSIAWVCKSDSEHAGRSIPSWTTHAKALVLIFHFVVPSFVPGDLDCAHVTSMHFFMISVLKEVPSWSSSPPD